MYSYLYLLTNCFKRKTPSTILGAAAFTKSSLISLKSFSKSMAFFPSKSTKQNLTVNSFSGRKKSDPGSSYKIIKPISMNIQQNSFSVSVMKHKLKVFVHFYNVFIQLKSVYFEANSVNSPNFPYFSGFQSIIPIAEI